MPLPVWNEKSVNQVLGELQTSENGLSKKEARDRLRRHGLNRIREEKGPGALSIFLDQFSGFLIRILLGATVLNLVIGETINAVAIFIIVVVSALLGFYQEFKAEKTMAALRKMTAHEAVVIRNGQEMRVKSENLVPGDIVLVEEGSRVPADMRILEAVDLKADEASLTGESASVSKSSAPVCTHTLGDMKSMLWSGTTVTYGRGMGVVTETGMSTQIGKIAHIVQETGEELTPLQRKLDAFGHRLGLLILGICAMVVVVGIIRLGPLSGVEVLGPAGLTPEGLDLVILMVTTGIALAVAAIPEGLVAIVTTTLALGVRRLSSHNALMRKLPAVETLGSTTAICTDKTGTLTKNEMTVTRIWHSGKEIELTGRGYVPSGKFLFMGREVHPKTDSTLMSVLRSGSLCSNARLVCEGSQWSIIGDPTEGSLVVAASKAGLTGKALKKYERIKEFPFSSERKRMSVVTQGQAHVKGAPETVLGLCTHVMVKGTRKKLTNKMKKEIEEANHTMTSQALRVLAVATRKAGDYAKASDVESGLTFLGLVGMIDPPRESVKNDIELCKKAGIKIVMITGDHANTAYSIARQLSLCEGEIRVLTGEELDKMDDNELKSLVQKVSVYARVNPEHKVRIVSALRRKGHIIAMTGDGVNDAPALKKADIGVAMGIKGTDVSKEASDMILRDDNFSTIVTAVREGRGIYDNIKKFIQYLLSSNVGEVLIVFLAILIGFTATDPSTGLVEVVVPLTVIQLLWVNLLTDGLPALALGVDPPAPNIMERPPRSPREKILSRGTLTEIFFVGSLITAGTLFLFWLNLGLGPVAAMTVAFTSIVMFEMVRVQAVRMKYRVGLFSNPNLILAMATSVLLQLFVIYSPLLGPGFGFVHEVFSTTFLAAEQWAQILLVSAALMVVMMVKDRLMRPDI